MNKLRAFLTTAVCSVALCCGTSAFAADKAPQHDPNTDASHGSSAKPSKKAMLGTHDNGAAAIQQKAAAQQPKAFDNQNHPNNSKIQQVLSQKGTPEPAGGGIAGAPDACPGPTVGEGSFAYDMTNSGGTDLTSCAFNDVNDQWYHYVPTATGTATVATCGQTGDTTLSAFASCGGAQVACNDDFCGLLSTITFAVTQGVAVEVRVAGYNGSRPVGTLTISVSGGGGGPANDNCTGAIALDGDVSGVTFDTSTATGSGIPECGVFGISNHDIFYCWTAECDGSATASLCGSSYDTEIAIYDGCACPPAGTCLVSNDDFCGLQSQVTWAVTAGHQYLVQVGGFSTASGAGTLSITCQNTGGCTECPPGGLDEGEPDCGLDVDTVNGGCNSNPNIFSPISCGQTYCGTGGTDGSFRDTDWYQVDTTADTQLTWCVTASFPVLVGIVDNDGVPSCAGVSAFLVFATGNPCDVVCVSACLPAGSWWLFVAPSTFSGVACPSPYVATLTCDPCTVPTGACCIAGNCTELTGAGCTQAGGAYFGDFSTCDTVVCLQNDDCSNPQVVGAGSTAFDNLSASDGGQNPGCGAGGLFGPDVWFCYTVDCADNNGQDVITIDTCGSGFDTVLAVYDGCSCPTAGPIACNDDSCGLQSSVTLLNVPNGTQLLIQIGGWAGATGFGTLNISCQPGGCVPDCPPGSIDENEPDCGIPTDSVNGGCNTPCTVPLSPIQCGQTYCGTGAFDGATRDTDWYRLVLANDTLVTWTVQAEFPALLGIIDTGGAPDCDDIVGFLVFATTSACQQGTVSACLPAGEWWLFAAPQFIGTIPCGSRYVATVTCEPCEAPRGACCLSNGDCVNGSTAGLCAEQGGTYQGDFSDCSSVFCQVVANDDCATAEPIAIGGTAFGDTSTAHVDVPDAASCSGVDAGCPTQWYSVVGDGSSITASLCGSAYDTSVSVYCGTCDALTCVAGNDDFCGLQSQVTWCSELGRTYYIRVAGFVCSVGSFTVAVSSDGFPCTPTVDCSGGGTGCDVVCDPSATPEGEENCGLNTDCVNGGCNSVPPIFSPIVCGQTYCGTGGNNGSFRDTDWYQLDLASDTTVIWCVTAEFDVLVGIVENGGIPSCAGVGAFRVFAIGTPCTETCVTATLPAGSWWLFVAPSTFTGVNCGAEYQAHVSCGTLGACCTANDICTQAIQSDCEAAGGEYLGDGTSCPSGYAVSSCDNAFEDINGAGDAIQGCTGDDCFSSLPIGFNFTFYGNTYTDVNVASNGYIQLGSGSSIFTNDPVMPSVASPNNLIAPNWDDWRTDQGGSIWVATRTSPTRCIIQWQNVIHFATTGTFATFEAILYEDGCIEYRYADVPEGDPNWTPTIGIENSDGTQGLQVNNGDIHDGTCVRICPSGENPCVPSCLLGDANCDGVVDNSDIDCFVAALLDQTGAQWQACALAVNPNCTYDYTCVNDTNHDGVVDNSDIDSFVSCLVNQPAPGDPCP